MTIAADSGVGSRFSSADFPDLVARLRSAQPDLQPTEVRRRHLSALLQGLRQRRLQLLAALAEDLGKPALESFVAELSQVEGELRHALANLGRWTRPRSVATPWYHWPAYSRVQWEPLGVVLIIAPWNYPLSLALAPLVAAIAAGNAAVVKPSELTPATSAALATLVRDFLDPALHVVVEGDGTTAEALLEQRFDHILFTGSTRIGQQVMAAAARQLTPVTLELGGKSPAIVAPDADLELTAQRLVWGKCLNAGQTCVAPDYLLVPASLKESLLAAMIRQLERFYGSDPVASPDLARIVSDHHWQRLTGLLAGATVLHGGQSRAEDRFLAPTLVEAPEDHPLWQEEIFGPILPVRTYADFAEAIAFVRSRPKPLACYLFSRDRRYCETLLRSVSAGSVGLNDTILQISTPQLPFGGVGASGCGRYHGRYGFETFSHAKAVMGRWFLPDLPLRFPPYAGKLPWLERLLG